nr:hypothetical protein [uncultured Prevotella sp.]
MKKLLIFSLLVLLASPMAYGQNHRFSSFLAQLNELSLVGADAFGDSILSPNIDVTKFQEFLPKASSILKNESECLWQGGGYIRKDDFIVAFLQAHFPNCHDGNEKWFMENLVTCKVLVSYSQDGKLLDSRTIGKRSGLCELSIEPSSPGLLTVEQRTLASPRQLHEYADWKYSVQKNSYFLTSIGKIKSKILWKGHKTVPNKFVQQNPPLTFKSFLRYFKRWEGKVDLDSLFTDNGDMRPYLLLRSLLTDWQPCDCWPVDLQWTPCRYVETDSLYYFFVVTDCSFTKKKVGMYADRVILIFDKDGTLRDVITVSRNEDGKVTKFLDEATLIETMGL